MAYRAEVMISETDDQHRSVFARIDGSDSAETLKAAEAILERWADSSDETFVRAKPEIVTHRDFDSQETRYRGYVRFITHVGHKGEWSYATDEPVSLPLASV